MDRLNVEFLENEQLTEQQQDAVKHLKSIVHPPDTLPQRLRLWLMRQLGGTERRYTWASPQWLVLMTEGHEVIATVGVIVREIISAGDSKTIGGICRVMTHPAWRERGVASSAMQEAVQRFHHELEVAFALLFCRPPLVPFYERLLWKPFDGKVLVDQPQGKIDFTSKGAMVLDVREQAPLTGTLDLNGLPW